MKPDRIPLVWDNGRIGSVAPDANGTLRLRHAIDNELEHELHDASPPYHRSPAIDATEVTALIDELAWHRR